MTKRANSTVLVCLLLLAVHATADEPGGDRLAEIDLGEMRVEEEDDHRDGRQDEPSARPPACLDREPSVDEMVRAAQSRAGLLVEDDLSRRRRLSISGWLPKLSGGVSMDVGDRWDYRYEPGEPRVDRLQQDDGLRWDVGLSWDLARMAFVKEELSVAREAVRRAAERRDLAVEVIRLAYARRRLMSGGVPASGTPARVQLDETTAILDAWTGGKFSKLWCGRRS